MSQFLVSPCSPWVLVHASAIVVGGRAILFLGPSETGKTTTARMLSGQEQGRWLSDDAVYIFFREDRAQWYVTNADCKAFERPTVAQQVAKFGAYPLQAILRLYRAAEPGLEEVDVLMTCRYLIDAYFEINFHTPLTLQEKQADFKTLALIARAIQGEEFYFDLSQRTRTLIEQKFMAMDRDI